VKPIFSPTRGFTLIELLIVIAIILILIAIAMPNFLEAQIRAKVTRAMADMRTIATALESYFIDFKVYPADHEPDNWHTWHGLYQLTTPLSYLANLPEDPFSTNSGILPARAEIGWELASTGNPAYLASRHPTQDDTNVHAYAIDSCGPDTGSALGGGSSGSDDFWGNMEWPFLGRGLTCPTVQGWMTYSPTNGSKSKGDIVRVGGQHRCGRYCIDNWNLVRGHYPDNAP
jgi:general secretion pathway protein G